MDFGIRAVHPCAAEPTSFQNDGPIASPGSRIVILAPDREANGRWTLPFPLPEKFIQFRGCDHTHRVRDYCALDVQAKIRWRIKKISPDLAGLMSQAQVPDQCALAVPRKISCEIGKWNFLVSEPAKSNVSDDIRLEAIGPKIYRAGNLDDWRRLKFDCRNRLAKSECVKKRFQIQTAARLQTRLVALHIPVGAPGKTAHTVVPFAMCNIQLLVVPFCCGGEVFHFIAAPLQSIAAEGRFYMRLLELGDVAAKFYL